MRVRRRALVLAEDERTRQCPVLSGREGSERLLEHRIEEIADAGERERRLALGRPGREDAESTVARFFETCLPEGGLPHAGIAFEREHDRSRGDARHEAAKGRELRVPSYDARGHDPMIVGPMPGAGKASGPAGRARRPPLAYMRKTPNVVSGTGAFAAAASPSPSTRRVSRGSMIPSSQRRAVE